MKDLLFRLVGCAVPAPEAEYCLGDLEEEAASKSRVWLFRHALLAAYYGIRLRAREANALETGAATAFLIGIPFTLALALRRTVLTLVPHRESAEFSVAAVAAFALGIAILTFWETRLLRRRYLPVVMATLITALIVHLATPALHVLTAAAFLGGSLATRTRQGGTQ